MKPAALRIQAAIFELGLRREVIELPVEARTSQQAADAVGVGVGQIAKSLVFTVDGAPVMVVASGANARVRSEDRARISRSSRRSSWIRPWPD